MRDWDRNGKIDARDRYIFHEIILKDDTSKLQTENSKICSCRNYTKPQTEPKKITDMSVGEILVGTVIIMLDIIWFILA